MLENDIGLLGLPITLLILGRQVVNDHGGRVDPLAIDQEGSLYVIEVKKDRPHGPDLCILRLSGTQIRPDGRLAILDARKSLAFDTTTAA